MMMNSVKSQTLASLGGGDSGGKKSRVRRSKEERKSMVESFIKRYQSLNNGNFPSLNLTHKQVGGSFYTVREIVREIIQENRVLGPGHFSSDDVIPISYPIGTISLEPQDPSIITQHIDLDVEHQVNVIGEEHADELLSVSKSENDIGSSGFDVSLNINEKSIDYAHVLNHIDISNTPLVNGLRESDTLEVDGESGQTGSFQAKLTLPTEDVEVETFPPRPTIKESDANSFNSESKVVTSSKDDIAIVHNQTSHISAHGDSTSATGEENDLQLQPRDALVGTTYLENSDETISKNAKEQIAVNGISFKKDEKATVGSSPVNRIDLESWRASKKETNPLIAFVKAFIGAFSRFWSE